MATTPKQQPKRGGKLKKPIRAPYLPVRISAEQIDRIDAVRPDQLSRESYIRYVLDIGLNLIEEEG